MAVEKSNLAIFISGSGSNLQAIIERANQPSFPGKIAVVISNRRDAYGLERARTAGIPAIWISHRKKSRQEFEQELLETVAAYDVNWIALAGFMRVLTAHFLSAFPNRVLNIHPSLLPSFPGLHAQEQAFDYGVKVTGATVHLVDTGMDTGPIVIQKEVPVFPDDNKETLKARILSVEHKIYPQAIVWALSGLLKIDGRRVWVNKR